MPIVKVLIAALAFGLSAPLAKLLLDVVSPLFLAGLLYLGAGVFLGLVRLAWRRRPAAGRPLTVRDRLILAGVVLTGGVLAPPLLLWGLERSSATTTALLLNLEVVFTVVLAGIVFGEHLSARVAIAAGVMAVGGIVLGWTPGDPAIAAGAALMALATWLLLHEHHLHRHHNPTGTHIHVHVHDDHHQHAHEGWEGPEPHSHPHPSGPIEHEHPHTPDIHHDHGHG